MKMTNTKKALAFSLVSLLLCISMLVGSTFAWFTDTASTKVNSIVAGNLDVSLMMKNAQGSWVNAEGQTLEFKDVNNNTNILWEPGATYKLPAFKLVNDGNLALKFNMEISGLYGDTELANALTVIVNDIDTGSTLSDLMADNDGVAHGAILPAGQAAPAGQTYVTSGESAEYTIALRMNEEAGNEYQWMSLSGITVNVFASQYSYEKDSISDQYDVNAKSVKAQNVVDLVAAGYAEVTNASELVSAVANNQNVVLAADVDFGEFTTTALTVAGNSAIVLDLNGYSITGTDATASGNSQLINNQGTLTIRDSAGTGEILLKSIKNRAWSASSNVITNRPGKTTDVNLLTVEGGLIRHLGGTSMAYAIDNLSVAGNANCVITGGTIDSSYMAIRQFLSTVGENNLTISGGTVGYVWLQSPNNNANKANLTINGSAYVDGRVYIQIPGPVDNVSVSINKANVGVSVTNYGIPYGTLTETNGIYRVVANQ